MTNLVTIDWPRDTPEIAVSYGSRLAQDHYDTAADVVCPMDVFIEVPRTQLADPPVFVGDGWTGTVGFQIDGFDGTCGAGSTDNEMLAGTFSVAFVATESMVSGTLEEAGDVLSFDGALASGN